MDAILNMLTLVLMTLNLMQGHSWSAKANNQRSMLSATKQALSIKLSTTVVSRPFLCDLDFANISLDHLVFIVIILNIPFLKFGLPFLVSVVYLSTYHDVSGLYEFCQGCGEHPLLLLHFQLPRDL